MATFYLLPPRPLLADHLASLFTTLLPGLDWDVEGRGVLLEGLTEAVRARKDVYLLFRDDLPLGETAARALTDGFGAEAGDEVVEVHPSGRPGEFRSRRWRLENVPIAA